MNAHKLRVIDDFYILSELLDDDIETICDFIIAKIPKDKRRHKRSRLKRYVEMCDYLKIEKEIDYLLDLPIAEYIQFKIISFANRKISEQQRTIFDYL